MSKSLTGKVAFITGGSRGLGAATALALAEQGAHVAISYIESADKAARVVEQIQAHGVTGAAFRADQGDALQSTQVIDAVMARFGRLDILVSNASIDQIGRMDDPSRDVQAFDRFWQVSLMGYMSTIRAASKVLSDDGRIIMISSSLGVRVGMSAFSDLAALRGAIDGYGRGVARDLSARGITANVIHAGPMETDLNLASQDALAPLLAKLCFPRFARLEEVVAPIVFLASPAASFITGTSIDADGGYSA